uniref:Putative secreted protein n=1 Tax=Ixodes ricinus TaxID=34613 RepID=A0A6B0TUZ7_IXORI
MDILFISFLCGVFHLLFYLVIAYNIYLITVCESRNVILAQDKISRLATIYLCTESFEAFTVRRGGTAHLKWFILGNT